MKENQGYLLFALVLVLALSACGAGQPAASEGELHLILGAYTTPREAYSEIVPLFQSYWLEQTGQTVTFEESYLGSGAQSRAVVEGFEADVVALSLEADVTRIVDAGLITHDWKGVGYNGMVSTSVVVFAVRAGNPLGIAGLADLAQPGVEILTPNPATSGGAMWNILSLYGAAMRGYVDGVPADDPNAAKEFLIAVFRNVIVMDKGARESITNYEQGVGNLAITYENEVLVGQQAGNDYQMVFPASSILIENPAAVVDAYVDKHGTREVAEAFVEFLASKEAQEAFARHGLRSVDPEVAAATTDQYPPLTDIFSIDFFGGWPQAIQDFFSETGIFNQAIQEVQGQ
jgi:sulfate/thiosulfate-binding protein